MNLVRLLLPMGFLGMTAFGLAKESSAPESAFRKYFWGARKAYEQRDFKKAERLLQTYKDKGSPSDRLLKLAGCDPKWEVDLLSTALKETRACLRHRSKSSFWTDGERAKFLVLVALREGDFASLEPYVECAPTDLVPQSTTCGARVYRQPADLKRLAGVLKENPDILKRPNWREFPLKANDRLHIRWVLYTYSEHWQPCGMAGSPIVSLRQEPSGEIRIAGFAASCL